MYVEAEINNAGTQIFLFLRVASIKHRVTQSGHTVHKESDGAGRGEVMENNSGLHKMLF